MVRVARTIDDATADVSAIAAALSAALQPETLEFTVADLQADIKNLIVSNNTKFAIIDPTTIIGTYIKTNGSLFSGSITLVPETNHFVVFVKDLCKMFAAIEAKQNKQ